MSKATEVAGMLDAKLKEYWLNEPEDVTMLRTGGVQGAYRHISTAIVYCESETREMVDYLWYMMNLVKQDKIDLNVAKTVVCTMIDAKQDKWTRWYGLKKFPPVLKEAVLGMQSAKSKEEFYVILEVLQILVGKFNFWLDRVIPWMIIASVFDWTLQGK